MSSRSSVFPAFIRAEYDGSSDGFAKFERAMTDTVARTERAFEASSAEIAKTMGAAMTRGVNSKGGLDLGVSEYRQAAAEARLYAQGLNVTLTAATALAQKTGDVSAATRVYLQSLQGAHNEAKRAAAEADAQVTSYTRLQAATDALTDRNGMLAASYRNLFAEQAKSAQAEVVARRIQQEYDQVFAPGLTRTSKSASGSASAFEANASLVGAPRQLSARAFDPAATQAAAAAAHKLADEQERLALAAERVVKTYGPVTEHDRALALSLRETADAAKFEAARLDGVAASERRLEGTLETTNAAIRRQGTAFENMSRIRKQTLIYTASDLFSSLGSGIDPFRILLQQGPQVAQVFALEEEGLKGMLRFFTPTTVAVGTLTAALVIGAKAWLDYSSEINKTRSLAQGIGAAVGATAGDLEAAAKAGADAAHISTSAARDMETAFLSTGKIGSDVMGRLIGVSKDFAAATGTDAKQAVATLGEAFADPERGAQTLNEKLGFLDQTSMAYIRTLVEQNRLTDAQAALLNALVPAIDGAAEHLNILERAWRSVSTEASKSFENMGQAIDILVNGRSVDDLVASAKAFKAAGLQVDESELARLVAIQTKQKEIAKQREANKLSGRTSSLVDQYSGDSEKAALQKQFKQVEGTLNDPRQSLTRDQRAKTVEYYNALKHAVDTYIPSAEKQVQLAQLDAKIAATTSPARKAALAAQRERLQLSGQVITATNAEAIASANAAKAGVAASRSQESAARSAIKARITARAQLTRLIARDSDDPSAIQRAAEDNATVDKIIAELTAAKHLTAEISDLAGRARASIESNMTKPYRDFVKAEQESLAVGELVARGRDVEAQALGNVLSIQKQMGPLTRDQLAQVLALAQAQERISNAVEDQRRVVGLYVDAVHDAQRTFETFLGDLQRNPGDAFKNLGKNLKDSFRGLQTKLISEQLFGGLDREIERFVKGDHGIEAAGDYLTGQIDKTGKSLDDLITSLQGAAERIGGIAANDNGLTASSLSGLGLSSGFISSALSSLVDDKGNVKQSADGDILVTAAKEFKDQIGIAGTDLVSKLGLARAVNEKIWNDVAKKFTANLEQMLGTTLPSGLGSVLGGGFAGYAQAGPVGALLGAAKSIKGISSTLSGSLDKAIGGAQTGAVVAGIGKALGLKTSKLGGQIGGAIGSALPIPGGQFIGAAIGSIVGGLFKKTKTGSATLGYDQYGNLSVSGTSGNSKSYIAGASKTATGLIGNLQQIADQLGGTLGGNIGVSIGQRKKSYVVDTTGQGRTKGAGVEKFKDQAEAVKAALRDAINDGAILGLSAGTRALIQKSGDLETQLGKAVKFENVFKELRRQTDPVGAAIDDLNDQFTELQRIFKEAGASAEEYSQLEQLYALQRKQAVESAASQMTNTLKSLMQDLTTNNDAFSLKDRLGSALAEYNPLASRVAAGDKTVDYDAFAEAARNVLDIQRQLSGSQQEYFDRLNEVTGLTAQALKGQENVVSIANASTTPFDVKTDASPKAIAGNDDVVASIGDLTGVAQGQLGTLNNQVATLNRTNSQILQVLQAGGSRSPYLTDRLGF